MDTTTDTDMDASRDELQQEETGEGEVNQSQIEVDESRSQAQLMEVVAVIADEQLGIYDDLETGTLPVIELPTISTRSSRASTTTNDSTASPQMIELMVAGVVEAPRDGTFTLEDLEAAPVAHLVKMETDTMATSYDDSDACCGAIISSETCGTQQQQQLQMQQLPSAERRAEFISATVHKAVHTPLLGMDLACDENGDVAIASIEAGSLMSKTPFHVGDRLLSVNTKRCYVMDAKAVLQFIATLVGNVTIVVHNEGGDPNLVESMITKPSVDHRCGLGLASSGRQHLKVSNIDADGLFFDTLLNVGDPVVSINDEGCEVCDAQDAGDIIARSGLYITIKARTLLETGVVVAAFSCGNSIGSTIPPEINSSNLHPRDNTPSTKQLAGISVVALGCICLLLGTGLLG